MELRHLRSFVTVAEQLSFRRAAELLHMAQPPLSAQIKALETELQVRLFERTTRRVRLTQAGRCLLEDARAVLAAAVRAQQRVRDAGQGLSGTLRIGLIAPIANAWLAGILRKFRQQFPGIQLSLFDLTSAEQLRRLKAEELDAGLLRPPVTSPELETRFVRQTRQVLALPEGHPLAARRNLKWSDFHEQDLVLIHPASQHGFYDAFLDACAKAGARPRVAQYAHDIQIKMWLISAGFGIGPTTAMLAEGRRSGLVFRELPSALPLVPTVLAWRRDNDSPALAHFRKSFEEAIPLSPPTGTRPGRKPARG